MTIDMTQYFYYEPPSRLQLVDKLEHLARYSDFLVVVTGGEGSGKTSVIKKFLNNTQGEGVKHIALSLTGETSDLQLAELCAKALSDEEADADPLTQLHEQSRSFQEVGQQLHLVIDNAEWLNDEAIELLSGLLMTGIGRPKIVLSGDKGIINRLHSLSISELLEGRLHIEELQPFELDECKEFLKLAFASQPPLKKKVVKELFESSGGYPGKLTAAASELYRSGKVAMPNKTALPLPPAHILGISAVLLAVLGISVWQFYPEEVDTEQQVVSNRVSVPLSVQVPDQLAIEDQIEEVKSTRSELSKRLEEQERLLAEELKKTQQQKNEEPLAAQETTKTQDKEPVQAKDPVSPITSSDLRKGVAEIEPPEPVIDNLASDKANNVETKKQVAVKDAKTEDKSSNTAETGQLTVKLNEKSEVTPTSNTVEPAKPANNVEKTLVKAPESDTDNKTKVVKVAKVAEKTAEQVDKKAAKQTGKVAQVAEKTPKSVVKSTLPKQSATSETSSPWLKEKELLTWPSKGYTLQVLGARSGKSVEEFMASKASRDKLYYFTTLYKGKPWHVVVFGQYANRDAAKRAINSLPSELKKLKPWPRSIKGVQLDISKK